MKDQKNTIIITLIFLIVILLSVISDLLYTNILTNNEIDCKHLNGKISHFKTVCTYKTDNKTVLKLYRQGSK